MSALPGLWVELLDDDVVERALPTLAKHVGRVHLALGVERVGDPSFARLSRQATDLGLAVWLWPLFPFEQGYWLGEHNAALLPALMRDVLSWRRRREGVACQGVSFDLEPAHDYARELRRRPVHRLFELLVRHVEPERFEVARVHLGRAIDVLHVAGVEAHAVTFPLVLDCPAGCTVLEDALDIPLSDLDWDEASFMVYQTAFAELVGTWLGPSLVFAYAKSAVERFGARAGLDLGVVGAPAVGLGERFRYPAPAALHQDLAAAQAAGIPPERLRVYGLAGVLQEGGTARWLSPLPRQRRPEPSRAVVGMRHLVHGLATALTLGSK